MTPQSKKTTVGAFALGGILLFALGIILLGGGRLFSNDIEYVLFFDGSVSGLSIGAPVVFRGVPMGTVTRISLVANARDSNVTIPVSILIDEKSFVRASGGPTPNEAFQQEIIRRMVQRGLRARLQMQSFITGQYRVELDFFPESAANFRSSTPDMEIPTVPSPIDALQRTLAKLPLEQMVLSLDQVLASISSAVGNGKLEQALAAFTAAFAQASGMLKDQKLRATLNNLEGTTQTLQQEMPAVLTSFRTGMDDMGKAARELRAASASAQQILERDSPVLNDVRRLIREATATVRSLRDLANTLDRNPESLLKGKKGKH